MMNCLLIAGQIWMINSPEFTLSWQHSVEHTEWVEHWQIQNDQLQLTKAKIRGSGAGMEVAPGAKLIDGWWVYEPDLKPLKTLNLAASGATSSPWTICSDQNCQEIGKNAGETITIQPCQNQNSP